MRVNRRWSASRRRASERHGTAGLEFALVAPLMISLLLGIYDISKAVILRQQIYNAAHSIPISASSLAVQTDKSTSLTVAQVQSTMSGIFAEVPWIRSGGERGAKSVTMSAISFTQVDSSCNPATSTCAYNANVAWSVAYADPTGRFGAGSRVNTFQGTTRNCGVLTQVGATVGSPSDLTKLRTAGVVNPDPILVVDVSYRYIPMFANFITGPIDFWANGYWPVRSVVPGSAIATQYTKYDIANQNGGVGKCTGFP